MVGLWKRVRRRALLRAPSDIQLSEYLECFTAGYNRGVADVRKGTRRAEWSPLIRKISEQLATDRSVVEAGCWRAGVRHGRLDEVVGVDQDERRMQQCLCVSWETAYIADRAMECATTAVNLGKVLAALCQWRKIPPINGRLSTATDARQQTM